MGIGLVYWLVLILPQGGRAWSLPDGASSELTPPERATASLPGSADPGPGSGPA